MRFSDSIHRIMIQKQWLMTYLYSHSMSKTKKAVKQLSSIETVMTDFHWKCTQAVSLNTTSTEENIVAEKILVKYCEAESHQVGQPNAMFHVDNRGYYDYKSAVFNTIQIAFLNLYAPDRSTIYTSFLCPDTRSA